MRCDSCVHFMMGTDAGYTKREGKMFGLCRRAGSPGSMTQPVRWDEPAGLRGPIGPLGPRGDGQPHTAEEIAAHEKRMKEPIYGTAYHDRTTLYVLPSFGCVEFRERGAVK